MLVSELIDQLEMFLKTNQDCPVYVRGYEAHWEDLRNVRETKMVRNINKRDQYCGDHIEASEKSEVEFCVEVYKAEHPGETVGVILE